MTQSGPTRPTTRARAARLLGDGALARRAAKGDERAFAAIYDRYGQSLYRFCLSLLGDREDAQDALQNTMLKALRALPGEQRQIQLKPWLYRVAHNESIELLRRRRDDGQIDPETLAAGLDPGEAVALRERLRTLLGDLAELPERQRAALLMRELAGLEFAQIGEALDTSAAVVRQTVYEARLSLRQLEAGREMSCEKVIWQLSEGDGRVTRRREIQAHLRDCAECRGFDEAIAQRRRDFAAIAPLPAAASAALLHAVLGGGKGGAGLTGALGGGTAKVVVASTLAKSAATVAVVTAIGVSAADRGGLIDAGIGGDGHPQAHRMDSSATSDAGVPVSGESAPPGARGPRSSPSGAHPRLSSAQAKRAHDPSHAASPTSQPQEHAEEHGPGSPSAAASPTTLPAASNHGQETAAAHGGGRGHPKHGAGGAASHGSRPDRDHPSGHSKSHPAPHHRNPHPGAGPKPPSSPPPGHSGDPPGGVGPDKSKDQPFQSPEPPSKPGPSENPGGQPSKEAR
jgi:RNA polymerase sigma factor (sigma-70 family)